MLNVDDCNNIYSKCNYRCRDLNAGLRCIDEYTRRCMAPHQRSHFNKLYASSSMVIQEICQEGPYQDGKSYTTILSLFQNKIKTRRQLLFLHLELLGCRTSIGPTRIFQFFNRLPRMKRKKAITTDSVKS